MLTLGVDIGTSGCKAVVFDEKWTLVCSGYEEYSMTFPGDGLLELDAEMVWEKTKAVIRKVNQKLRAPISAMAVSAIGDVIIPLDDSMNAVRNSIIDFDPRGGKEIEQFVSLIGEKKFFEITGMPPLYIGSLAKILWIKNNEPETYRKITKWATYEDFIVGKLGMPRVVSFSEASRTMLFDIRKKQWANQILDKAELSQEQFAQAKPSGSVIGTLSAEIADELGFVGKVQVIAGGHDMVCAAVGSGLDETNPQEAVDIAGTIEGLVVAMEEPETGDIMLENNFPCYPAATGYVTFSVNLTAGCIVRWYRDYIASTEYKQCVDNQSNFYEYMLRNMDPSTPSGMLLLPHFSGSGNPYFNPKATGALLGITLDTSISDIARAIVEGLAYEIRLHIEAFKESGITIRSLRAVGGGAMIDKQLQMKANVIGIPIVKGAVTESSGMGAAAYAAYGIGAISNPAEAYKAGGYSEQIFYPDMEANKKFSKVYEKYKELSESVDGIEREIEKEVM